MGLSIFEKKTSSFTAGAKAELAGLMRVGKVTTATSTTVFASTDLVGQDDDAFDGWYVSVLQADNAAPEGESQPMSDYVSSTGTITHTVFTVQLAVGDWVVLLRPEIAMLGNVSTSAATGAVTATDLLMAYIKQLVTEGIARDILIGKVPLSDGSISWNATALGAIEGEATDAIEADDLDHLLKLDGATQVYPENMATDSILAKLMVKADPAVPSTFNNSTDSLEAIADAVAAIPTTMVGTDSAALASVVGALNSAAATGAVTTNDLVMAYLKQLVTNSLRVVHQMDFWSEVDDLITIDATAGDETLPSVVVAEIPTGAVVLRVIAMIKIGAFEDTSAAENKLVLAGTEHIQIDKSGGTYIDAIKLIAGQWLTGASAVRGGDVMIGNIDVASEVDANDTYEMKIENADVTGASLLLRDVQTGLRVYFTLE